MAETMEAAGDSVSISERAAKRISDLIAGESNDALMLRVTVSGGGCSGFQYGFSLDDSLSGHGLNRIARA